MHEFQTDLTFLVENLGSINKGEFVQRPLTVFCGPNNAGKTWTLYSLYYSYSCLLNILKEKEESNNHWNLDEFNKSVSSRLANFVFNTSSKQLNTAKFHLKTSMDWQSIIKYTPKTDIFLMPAERNGLHLFFRELSTRRTALLHHASREKINISELLRDVILSRYALPIADYIDWLNSLVETQRSGTGDFHDFAERLKKDLAGGAYKVDARTGGIEFKPYQLKRDGLRTPSMGLHMTSGTVKSLFGLWFYLEHQACEGDVLMIDEPELNIHPDNQRKISRLLAKLVNAGLNVVISTHSDYMVREFNSLIMLSRDNDKTLRKKHGYDDDEILKPEQVGAFLFDQQTIQSFKLTAEDGIYATTFDEVIKVVNEVNDDIYYSLKEKKDEQKAKHNTCVSQ